MPEYEDPSAPSRAEKHDLRDWEDRRDSAAGTIFLCLDDNQKQYVQDSQNDPEKMWDMLKALHLQRKAGPRFSAYQGLFSITKKENKTHIDLLARVMRAMGEVKALRPSHFGISQLEEELQVMAIIRAFPDEDEHFVSSLFLLDKLDLNALCAALHNKDNSSQLRGTHHEHSTTSVMQAQHPPRGQLSHILSRGRISGVQAGRRGGSQIS